MNNLTYKGIICLIVLAFICFKNTAEADDTPRDPDDLKAIFIMKFPEFIEWPSYSTVSDPHSPFVIGVLGDTPILSILGRYSNNKKIRDKEVKVIAISDYSQIKTCNALFIATCSRKQLKEILQEIDHLPILTIGDTKNYERRGVMINLFILGGQVRFNVNYTAAKKRGIMMESKMVRYAKTIIK